MPPKVGELADRPGEGLLLIRSSPEDYSDCRNGCPAAPQTRLQREGLVPGRTLERERGLATLQRHRVLPEQAALRCHPDRALPARAGRSRRGRLLKTSIEAAVTMKTIKPLELERVTVDATVQEKAILMLDQISRSAAFKADSA